MCLFGNKRLSDFEDSLTNLGTTSKRTTRSSMMNPKFVVIGAGVAGIACATKLLESFANVVVLEASERIGGRIKTVRFGDNFVDLGAQWCHGEEDNVVYEMVKDLDVVETSGDVYVTFQCIRSNGEVVDDEIVTRLKEVLSKIFNTRFQELRDFSGSLDQFLSIEFYKILQEPQFSDIDKEVVREFFENFKRLESCESAAHLTDVSAVGFTEYWECEGDYMLNWKDRGYKRYLEILMEAQDELDLGVLEGKIIFNANVVEIMHDRDDARVMVRCENMEKPFLADHVILTMSLGVLKEHHAKLFNPPLPTEKVQSINNIGYGNVAKIFMEFPEQFWPDDWTGFNTLWRFEDVVDMKTSVYGWLQDVYGFYCVNYQPRVLVAWCVGDTATLVEKLPIEEVTEQMVYLLKRFLPKWNIPDPQKVEVTDWMKNPHFRGAYSYRSLQTEATRTSMNMLSQPLTVLTHIVNDMHAERESLIALTVKPIVLFAGEATSRHFYSTVHGAVESGWREAGRLGGYYSLEF